MGRLFGTDGARGVANSELTCELAMQIGRAAAMVLTDDTHSRPRVLIGMDTRISSEMLEAALTAGFCSVGADVLLVGVVPTPAVAYLVTKYGYDAGVMISASHNPCEYNGIKISNRMATSCRTRSRRRSKRSSSMKRAFPPSRWAGKSARSPAHSMRSPTISAISFPQQICVLMG